MKVEKWDFVGKGKQAGYKWISRLKECRNKSGRDPRPVAILKQPRRVETVQYPHKGTESTSAGVYARANI